VLVDVEDVRATVTMDGTNKELAQPSKHQPLRIGYLILTRPDRSSYRALGSPPGSPPRAPGGRLLLIASIARVPDDGR
jgi:hypothetical protein